MLNTIIIVILCLLFNVNNYKRLHRNYYWKIITLNCYQRKVKIKLGSIRANINIIILEKKVESKLCPIWVATMQT